MEEELAASEVAPSFMDRTRAAIGRYTFLFTLSSSFLIGNRVTGTFSSDEPCSSSEKGHDVNIASGRFDFFVYLRTVAVVLMLLCPWCCSKYQHFVDISTVWTKSRWSFFFVTLILYFLHVFYGLSEAEMRNGGYAIVTYALGIYLLNLFIGFLTPQVSEFPILYYHVILC